MNIFKRIFSKDTSNIITIKSSWTDLTVQDMMDITMVLEDEDTEQNKILNIVSILTGKDVEYLISLPITTYKQLVNKIAFLQTAPKPNRLKNSYIINSHKYRQCADVTKITTAQFIDYNYFNQNNEKDLSKLLSVMLIPEGKDYNQGYYITDVQEDIKTMLYLDALAISFFLQRQFVAYVMLMADYSEKVMKENKMPKEQMKLFQDLRQVLKDTGLSLLY